MSQIAYFIMVNNKLFFLLVIIIGILLIVGGYFWWQKGNSGKKTVESTLPNILFLTNPVTEFTGKVDKISDNSIFIAGKYSITPPPTPPNAPTNIPGSVITVAPLPPAKVITYKVSIQPYTIINRPDSPIKYLVKKITPTPTPKLTIKDIKAGQMITVSAANDLRTLKKEEFDAYSVKLPPIINVITGKITDINVKEGIIILKAVQPVKPGLAEPTPEKPKEVEYAISVTADTEIARLGPTPTPAKEALTPKPAQVWEYKITDLKTDMQITVYANQDVIENQKIKALVIEPPVDLVPASTASPTTKPSVSPKI